MSTDIERQSATEETEDVNLPDSCPDNPKAAEGCCSWIGSCCSSICHIFAKAVKGVVFLVGITLLIALAVSGIALFFSTVAAALALSGGLSAIGLAFSAALFMAMPALLPLGLIICFSLPKKTLEKLIGESGDDDVDHDIATKDAEASGVAGMYNRARREEPLWGRIMLGSFGIIARLSLAALVWLALSLLVPRLKLVVILGSPMWRWSLLAVTLTAGYFQTLTLTIFPILFWPTGAVSYYLKTLGHSINHVAYFGLILAAWLAYFRTHHGLNHSNPRAFEYVTWTFVSLFVGSVLFLFKNFLLVKWSVDAIYRRFEPRILITSLKFYFIGLIAAGFCENGVIKGLKVVDQFGSDDFAKQGQTNPNGLSCTVTKYVMSTKVSLSFLVYLSRTLLSLGEIMSPLLDQEGDQEQVVNWFKQQINNDDTSDHTCTADGLVKLFCKPAWAIPPELAWYNPKGYADLYDDSRIDFKELFKRSIYMGLSGYNKAWKKITKNDEIFRFEEQGPKVEPEMKTIEIKKHNDKLANVLWRLVGEECSSSPTFTFDTLKIWMVDSHKDCVNMGRTLADAKQIVTHLDIFMSFVILVIIILLWLLITGVSSTTVLVTVATPFLALTFIFGDSAKIFFQGLIFCFATHPFDVGDRCILEGVEVEVKSVSILTTTFIKIGSKEKRLYPNSVLATKAIVNLGFQPDPKDVVELILDPSTNLDDMKTKITEYFQKENKHYENTYDLMIGEVGDKIKVTIHFTHVLTVHDISHSQCHKKKSMQRSNFLDLIKKYVNNKSPTKESDVKDQNADKSESTPATTTSEIVELTSAKVKET